MTQSATVHSSFTIERHLTASVEKVFAAFAHEKTKRRWFAEEKSASVDEYSLDFRVGGIERSRFRFEGSMPGAPPAGTLMGNDTTFLDIVPNERIVFAYVMLVGEFRMSASLATVELFPSEKGTRLVFTEQAAFFDRSDGPKLREQGWSTLLDRLGESLS